MIAKWELNRFSILTLCFREVYTLVAKFEILFFLISTILNGSYKYECQAKTNHKVYALLSTDMLISLQIL